MVDETTILKPFELIGAHMTLSFPSYPFLEKRTNTIEWTGVWKREACLLGFLLSQGYIYSDEDATAWAALLNQGEPEATFTRANVSVSFFFLRK